MEGNDDGKFTLESSHRAALVVKRSLDYDSGDHEFRLKIMASVIIAVCTFFPDVSMHLYVATVQSVL